MAGRKLFLTLACKPTAVASRERAAKPIEHATRPDGRPYLKCFGNCWKRELPVNTAVRRVRSVVEERFCKPLVGSSNLSPGTSTSTERTNGVRVDASAVAQ